MFPNSLAVAPSIFAPFRTPGTGCMSTLGAGLTNSLDRAQSFDADVPGSATAANAPAP